MPLSIGALSASALSHHSLSLADFITNIAESDSQYRPVIGTAIGDRDVSKVSYPAQAGKHMLLHFGGSMHLSDELNVPWVKKMKKFMVPLKGRALITGASVFRAVWSLRGAAGLAVVVVLVSAVSLLVRVQGKLVILPFEVRSDQSL